MLRVIPHPPHRSMFNGNNKAPGGYSQPQPVQMPQQRPQQQQRDHNRLSPQAISHIYKTCTNLFLTRRLPEALATLQPVIADPSASIRQCPRALRIKFWGLYLALLDSAAKMGSQEGKNTWGESEWPELVGKIRSGSVWDEANRAYGDEGRVDAEVVVSLATLLLGQPDQTITQKKIEAYLGAAPSLLSQDDNRKAMLQRSKITEIYILHVLPRMGDWAYAREFAEMSPDIDDEQREQFYATLESLQNDVSEKDIQTRMLEQEREREIEEALKIEQQNIRKAKGSRAPSTHSRSGSRRRTSSVKPGGRSSVNLRDEGLVVDNAGLKRPVERTKEAKKAIPTVVPRATGKTKPNTSLITSTTALLSRVQAHMAANSGPFSMLQTIVMLAVIAWMTNNKKMRDKIRKFLILCWIKLARTVGMGMKVTYV